MILGLIFWAFVALAIWGWIDSESKMTDEDKAERRRQRREYAHQRQMAELQVEAQKKARSNAIKGQVVGTAAKIALGAMFGGRTHHRH